MGRGPVGFRRPLLAALVTMLSVVAVDQASKTVVRASMRPGESFWVLRPVLEITHVTNLGAAFGLLQGARPLFVLTSTLALVAIAVYLVRFPPRSKWAVVGLGLIAGGAIGNLIDRVSSGHVTDFIDVGFRAFEFPVFNAADSAIVVGVGILMVRLLFAPGPEPAQPCDAERSDGAAAGPPDPAE